MNRKGFTLIELLIVIVVIGILATIAIAKFATTKEKAYLASMKSDLRNLATAQASYLSSQNPPAYATGTWTTAAPLNDPATGSPLYTPSSGVTVSATAVAGGWNASATHIQAPGRTCAIFYGAAAPVAPATVEGMPACN